jgi:Family of unknown function (DUF6636)
MFPIAVIAATLVCAHADASVTKFEVFRTPSGNIACGYLSRLGSTPASLRCDIRSGLRPEPRRRCELDWTGLGLGRIGRSYTVCAGDTVALPRARVLGYGATWRRNGFVCRSARAGLTCSNRSGHGFFLARDRWRLF